MTPPAHRLSRTLIAELPELGSLPRIRSATRWNPVIRIFYERLRSQGAPA